MFTVATDLVERAKAGDEDARQHLVEASLGYVRTMLLRVAGPSQELDDLQQDVVVRILTNLHRFRGGDLFSTWVGAICINTARDALRRRKVRRIVVPMFDEDGTIHQLRSTDSLGQLEARSELRRAEEAIAGLSDVQYVAFALRFAGHSVDEIAELMGFPLSTARLRRYYARKNFNKARDSSPSSPTHGTRVGELFDALSNQLDAVTGEQLSALVCRGLLRQAVRDIGASPKTLTRAQALIAIEQALPDVLARNAVSPETIEEPVSALTELISRVGDAAHEAPSSNYDRLDRASIQQDR